MNLKVFIFMMFAALILCFIVWFFVFRTLSFPGADMVSSAVYLLIVISFIVIAVET